MRHLHLLLQVFSQVRWTSGRHQINGQETPHTDVMDREPNGPENEKGEFLVT